MNSIKTGDLVSSFFSGYYRVVKITKRWEKKDAASHYDKYAYCITGEYDPLTCGDPINPLLHLIKIMDEDCVPVKSKVIKVCDSSHCRLAEEVIADRIKSLEYTLTRLKNFKNE